jgi:hypothetical protein
MFIKSFSNFKFFGLKNGLYKFYSIGYIFTKFFRYEFGVERSVSLENASAEQVANAVHNLATYTPTS